MSRNRYVGDKKKSFPRMIAARREYKIRRVIVKYGITLIFRIHAYIAMILITGTSPIKFNGNGKEKLVRDVINLSVQSGRRHNI